MPRPGHFIPGNDPVPTAKEGGWIPGPVWMGVANLSLTRIRFPDHPFCSKSLYQLCYPGPHYLGYTGSNWGTINEKEVWKMKQSYYTVFLHDLKKTIISQQNWYVAQESNLELPRYNAAVLINKT
jgi:hypothetical protein